MLHDKFEETICKRIYYCSSTRHPKSNLIRLPNGKRIKEKCMSYMVRPCGTRTWVSVLIQIWHKIQKIIINTQLHQRWTLPQRIFSFFGRLCSHLSLFWYVLHARFKQNISEFLQFNLNGEYYIFLLFLLHNNSLGASSGCWRPQRYCAVTFLPALYSKYVRMHTKYRIPGGFFVVFIGVSILCGVSMVWWMMVLLFNISSRWFSWSYY